MTSFQIHVGNLSRNTTDATLRQACSPFGRLSDFIVMRDQGTGRSRGFGFVTYSTREDAENAIAHLHNQQLDGRRVSATLSNATNKTGRDVYIGNINLGANAASTADDLTDMFGSFGPISDVAIMDVELGAPTDQFGLVTYQSQQPAEAAVSNLDKREFNGRLLAVSLTTEICLRLGSATSKDALLSVIRSFAGRLAINLTTEDRESGYAYRFGWVTYRTRQEAENAVAYFNGREVDGSTLLANIAGIYAENTDTFPFVPADDVQPTTNNVQQKESNLESTSSLDFNH